MESENILIVQTDGQLCLTAEDLGRAGFVPGDRLMVSSTATGQLFLRKVDAENSPSISRMELNQLLKEAFGEIQYKQREQVINLIREVRQEMVDDRD
ncbi:MAG: hypothetical protein AAF629_02635 [Chloroflexota bacterium]